MVRLRTSVPGGGRPLSETSDAALGGAVVIDICGGTAGSLAAMVLADHGAAVYKPAVAGPPRPASVVWDRGKLLTDDREKLSGLLARADLCVADEPAEALAGTPWEPDRAVAANPRLVYLHTPAWLGNAPWAGGMESDALLGAATGVALRQGSVGLGPVDDIYSHLVTVQGMWAAAAGLAALYERERSGRGQVVTVGGVHGVMVAAAGALNFDGSAPDPPRPGVGGAGGGVPFYRVYQCGDGQWLFLAALTPHFTSRAFAVLGLDGLLSDPRLDGGGRSAILRPEHSRWAIETIAAVFATRPRDHWLAALAAAGCPAGPLLDRESWLDHPQLAAIGMRLALEDPHVGPVVMPGVPLRLTATPGQVSPARHVGAGPEAVRPAAPPPAGAGTSDAAGSGRGGPLAGVRVIDLGAIIAGPFAASLLGELGADVVKVEPLTGDSFRGPGFAAYNKGQRGVAIDLRHAAGRAVLLRLAETADVVVDNYRPGVLRRLGLTYDDLCAVNPSIITLSITGFGEGGPLGQEAGFDPILQAMSGMMTAQGGDGDPVFFTVPVNDVAAAATGAAAVTLALLHRARAPGSVASGGAGGGQRTWTSLAAMSALLQAGELVRYGDRPPARRGGPDHQGPGPLDRFVAVADGWIRVQAGPGRPAAAEGDPLSGLDGLSREEACDRLNRAGIPAAPARRARELTGVEAVRSWGVLVADPRPGRETWWTTGRHARFSRTERSETLVSPALGEHTRAVLQDAGYRPDEIDELLSAGVIFQRD